MYVVFSTNYSDIIYHFTKSSLFNNLVNQNTMGSVRNSLNADDLLRFPFFDISESFFLNNQIKKLNMIEIYINLVKEKISFLKSRKTFYLNKMFV